MDDETKGLISYLRAKEVHFLLMSIAYFAALIGISHQLLASLFAPYRRLGARTLLRHEKLDHLFHIADILGRTVPGPEGRRAGSAKCLNNLQFAPRSRVENVGKRLCRADFSRSVLPGLKFESVPLDRTNWRWSELSRCVFRSCSIRDAVIKPLNARGTVFLDCGLDDSLLSGDLSASTFVRCSLRNRREVMKGTSPFRVDGSGGNFAACRFEECSLEGSNFAGVDFSAAVFERCDLSHAILRGACLRGATFLDCDLRGADLSEADISDLVVKDSRIYGLSLWSTKGEAAVAQNLSLAKEGDLDAIEIDGLHIASFVSSLIEGNGVRDLVDGLTSSMVLVLGRFSPPHKRVLDDIRAGLRQLGYGAVVFDSSMPTSRDATETVSILARLSRFVIVDLTEPKSAPHELNQFVADCATPVQVVTRGEEPFSMFADLEKYPWVLPAQSFSDGDVLLTELPNLIERLERRRDSVSAS